MGGIHCARVGNVAFLKTEFQVFTERLLLRELDGIPWEAHFQIMKEADAVAEIAERTSFPFLVFPCLFEERVSTILRQFHEMEASYWECLPYERSVVCHSWAHRLSCHHRPLTVQARARS
jgi:hypothetical protein